MLEDKLSDVLLSAENAADADEWVRSALHISGSSVGRGLLQAVDSTLVERGVAGWTPAQSSMWQRPAE